MNTLFSPLVEDRPHQLIGVLAVCLCFAVKNGSGLFRDSQLGEFNQWEGHLGGLLQPDFFECKRNSDGRRDFSGLPSADQRLACACESGDLCLGKPRFSQGDNVFRWVAHKGHLYGLTP